MSRIAACSTSLGSTPRWSRLFAPTQRAGAQVAIVGSSQEFFYRIGFAPVYNTHRWEKA